MIKFSHRVIGFFARKLNAINSRIEHKKNQAAEAVNENAWLSKFNDAGYFDHKLASGISIRLYKDSVLSKPIADGFENEEIDFLQRFLKKGDTFLDIGANIGLFSLEAVNRIGPEGRIFSFEPSPKTFARLKENVEVNNIRTIKPINIGLSNKEDILHINVSENGYDAWNSFAHSDDGKFHTTAEARVRKLDDVIKEEGIGEVSLVKLDVEGWEKFVLFGGEHFFKTQSPVVMVEFTESNTFAAGYHVQELFDILQGWGYQWYRYKDSSLVPEVKQLHYPYDNLFAIKVLDTVLKRIK